MAIPTWIGAVRLETNAQYCIWCEEIRIHVLGEWRVLYVAKFSDAIYVLHCFQKKTQKTRQEDMELAQRRFKLIGE